MQVSAILDPLSPTAREWRSRNLQHGLFMGVRFRRQGGDFIAEDLDPDTAAQLEGVVYVTLEIITNGATAEPPGFSDDELFAPVAKKSKK